MGKMKLRKFIPFHLPKIDSKKISQKLKNVLDSKWISTGPKVSIFENQFSKLSSKKYAVAVNSNTEGLKIAINASGVNKNDYIR